MRRFFQTGSTKVSQWLINRDFALFWSGQSISVIGDYLFDTTLIIWVADSVARGTEWAPIAVTGVLLATAIPILVLGPLAGVFVDRWNKRRIMLCMDAMRTILIVVLILSTGIIPLPFLAIGKLSIVWQLSIIYSIVFLSTTCAQFFNPSRFAFSAYIVKEAEIVRSTSLTQTTTSIASILGPAIAGPLYFGFGVHWALLIEAFSFFVSFLTIRAVNTPCKIQDSEPEENSKFFHEFREGFLFCLQNRVLHTILIVGILFMFGVGALNALDIFFVTQNLRASPSSFGFLDAAWGIGSIIGSIVASSIVRRYGVVAAMWVSVIAVGLAIIIYARQTSLFPALLLLFFFGLPNAVTNITFRPLILAVTPRGLVGRVISLLVTAISVAEMLSVAIVGALESTTFHGFHKIILGVSFGSIDTIFSISGLLIIAGGIYSGFILNADQRLKKVQAPPEE
jgi:MFS family permease